MSKIDQDVLKAIGPESEFAKDIEKYWDVELRKDITNEYDPIDFMIIRKNTDIIEGYIELKNRNISSAQYRTLMIDHKKMIELRIAKKGDLVKVLGRGKIDVPVNVAAHKFSASAEKIIEKAGGKINKI